jgi:acetyl esterase/lipase
MLPVIGLLATMMFAQADSAAPVIPLWPNGAPGSESRKNEPETQPHPWSTAHIYNPSLTVYRPDPGTANGTAIVIAPGGGHRELVVGEEGTKPAEYLRKLGVTAFVLKYRLFREEGSGLTFEKDNRADAFRAMRLVRANAAKWNLDPKRIGMLGFSAGGETLSLAAFGPAPEAPANPDAVDLTDGRPNFAMWVYPGPLGVPDKIPTDAPPAFLLVANDDGASNVVMDLARKYREAKVPVEMHILSGGGHGFNMGNRSDLTAVKSWPNRLADWLSDRGLLKPSK